MKNRNTLNGTNFWNEKNFGLKLKAKFLIWVFFNLVTECKPSNPDELELNEVLKSLEIQNFTSK